MKRFLVVLVFLASLSACKQYVKPQMAIDIVNKSHGSIRNLEIDYPGGSYGIPALDVYASDMHRVELSDVKKCSVTLHFEDPNGKQLGGKEIAFGQTCPKAIRLTVDSQLAVSGETIQQ